MAEAGVYLKIFVALCVLVNPLAGLLILLARTEGLAPGDRNAIGRTATIAVTFIMLVTLAIGRPLLELLSISAADFGTAGGIIIFLTALKMVLGAAATGESALRFKNKNEERGFGIVPLATPMLAGPGVISVLIVYTEKGPTGAGMTLPGYGILALIILAVGLVTGIALRAALPIQRLLGQIGVEVATRISGIIVAAIAISMIFQGLRSSFPILNHG